MLGIKPQVSRPQPITIQNELLDPHSISFLPKRKIHMPELSNSSLLFKIFSLYTNTFFPSSCQVSDASSMEGFTLTAKQIQDTTFKSIISKKFQSSLMHTLVQTYENHWGLGQVCEEGGL
jgi:hypothetical protein